MRFLYKRLQPENLFYFIFFFRSCIFRILVDLKDIRMAGVSALLGHYALESAKCIGLGREQILQLQTTFSRCAVSAFSGMCPLQANRVTGNMGHPRSRELIGWVGWSSPESTATSWVLACVYYNYDTAGRHIAGFRTGTSWNVSKEKF